eukprot:GFUD01020699.1.p1 GENE.GFUD01020699.1~~GFUD01020699.1.p1  ORF type:complete len:655 (+),score=122.20 GFUD01020699.1:219-2183(+)
MEKTGRCGLLGWRPQWVQRFARKETYILLYSILGAILGMGNSYLSVVLSTIEKQFGIRSQEVAWIFSGNEISQVCFILVIPFLSKIKKRPLWTSVALLLSALGYFLCAIPYLLKDKQHYEGGWNLQTKQAEDICGGNVTEDTLNHLDVEYVRDWTGIGLIFSGFFITGIGSSFFTSFGIPYIDDNVSKENSPLALSFVMASKMLGPTFGAILGGEALKIYVVPGKGEGLEEGDHEWLGAWWIGFVVMSALIACFAPFLSLFPERLSSEETKDAKKKEVSKEDDIESPKEYILNTIKCFKRLLKNKVYVFNALSTISLIFGLSSFATFGPKYFEYHFRQNASKSGSLSGVSRSLGAGIGIIMSGFLIRKYKFKARTLATWNLIIGGVLMVGFVVAYNLSCPKLEIYGGAGTVLPCQENCGCMESSFQPTCSLDGTTLFISPCHAGCTTQNKEVHEKDGKKKLISFYSDCSCIKEASITQNSTHALPWWKEDNLPSPLSGGVSDPINGAVGGFCPVDCSGKFYFLVGLLMAMGLLVASSKVGTQLLTLRSVEPEDKSASMILMISVLSLFVLLPSPVIVGSLMDNICTVWGIQGGQTTQCLLYDTDLMRTTLITFIGVCIVISTLMDFGVWWNCKNIRIFDEDDNAEEEMKSVPME